MSTSQRSPRAPRTRSAFGAAFLSLIFPGLGHAYAGAWSRALAFAALPLLAIAAGAGIALRGDKFQLLAFFANPSVLNGVLIGNVIVFLYRAAAAADAWNVARFLNAADASGDGRLGRAKMPINPLSVAGLIAIVLVMAGAHLVVWRYDALALSVVDCLNPDTTDVSCQPSDSPSPSDQAAAGSGQPSGQPSDLSTPTPLPTPIGTDNGATPAPTLPPWNGTDRLNILLVGTDQRNNSPSFNTDTTIVVSIDPKTKQVAMLQLPRDTANVPVPPVARSVWGTTYGSKINSWFAANQNLKMWPGKTATARGMAALESILGNLYGININYWVMVNFQGFTDAVNTLGGVQVNVQIPVAEDEFPLTDSDKTRLYIPAGPQEMDGQTALMYARSRHNSQGGDFDRGYRQQRVILSLKNELDPQTVFNNLTGLVQALKTSVKTNIPVTDAATMGKLLDLASRVDTKNIRSYVFAAPYYATDMYQLTGGTNSKVIINLPRVQSAVRQAFTLSPALITLRNTLSAEGAQVWVLDGKNGMGLAGNNAAYLDYYGMDASPLAQLAPTTPAATTITVYNGADTRLTATIRYLQNLYGATVKTAKSSTTKADIVIIIGMNAHSLTVPNAG